MSQTPTKAYLQTEQGDRIECLFNPAELTITKANTWEPSKTKGVNAPKLRFQTGKSGGLSVQLTFDTTHEGKPVTVYTDKLFALMKVDESLPGADRGRNKGRPPWVEFHWAHLHSFRAVLEQLKVTYTLFSSEGAPLRAKADVTLKQFEDDGVVGLQNPTSGTPDPHTLHRVLPGETIDRVAALHFGDATRWRLIAEANDVLDPLRIPAGTVLSIPEPMGVRRD